MQHNALAVMRFIAAIRTGYRRRTPAYAILVFEEIRLFGHRACRCFGEILVDAPFAARHIAAAAQKLIHHFLRYRKSEGCLRTLRLKIVHQLNLLVFCRQEKTHLLQLRRITA